MVEPFWTCHLCQAKMKYVEFKDLGDLYKHIKEEHPEVGDRLAKE